MSLQFCSDIIDLTQLSSDSDGAEFNDDIELEHTPTSTSMYAPTSAFSEMSSTPNTLMVLTEGRGIASEIAYCFFDLSTLQCTLSQYADGASYSRTIYAITTARPQTVFVPATMIAGNKSKAMLNIQRYLPWLKFRSIERRWFNDKDGMLVLREISLSSQLPHLERILRSKQYAYAALNAMFHHFEAELCMSFSKSSISVRCTQMAGTMLIDPGAWRDLSLDSDKNASEWSLCQAIDHTRTKWAPDAARKHFTAFAVADILDNEELFFFLSANLPALPDIDAAITSMVRQPVAATAKQISTAINNVLLVKHILQAAGHLAAAFSGLSLRSALLPEIVAILSDPRIAELLDHIHAVIRENITLGRSAQMTRSQRCHAVKDGVDGFLDVSRAIFDRVTQEVVDLVEQAVYKPTAGYIMAAKRESFDDTVPEEFLNVVVKKSQVTFTTFDLIKLNNRLASVVTEINLLSEKAIQGVISVIRENIVVLYRISEAIALLDVIVSFAHHCTISECVMPKFSDCIHIDDGRHPILDVMSSETVVANSVSTVNATFTVVSAPIWAATKSATLKIFDKLFVRMNNSDNLAANESTFLREMHDVAYILHNYDQHSLVMIDELGRSTATEEGKAICRAVCEEFIEADNGRSKATHKGCTRVVLSSTDQSADGQHWQFKATLGVQTESLYGIDLAERMGMPADVIATARMVASEFQARRQIKSAGRNTHN
ncbi:DNA mismatch repair protein MutS [Kickxella alabastrina]|uniref:DNA mismatch repair protein MutS n=1 Tax=Kickxella alabastrina TaxID=61397 RepID=UPI00221FE740|nr:DNA mismatch repair protein MutS [Kickxella alabastrina]KAI7820715.1 DNA mismatch repair protein MutS [Kickxella alabastrina]